MDSTKVVAQSKAFSTILTTVLGKDYESFGPGVVSNFIGTNYQSLRSMGMHQRLNQAQALGLALRLVRKKGLI